jgi:hypothetical protein
VRGAPLRGRGDDPDVGLGRLEVAVARHAFSSDTIREIITSSPGCQAAGVATGCLLVSWIESTARSISVKLRPVCIGYIVISLTFLSGSITKTLRTVRLSIAHRDAASP